MTVIPHDVMAAAWPIALDIVSQSQAVEAAQFTIARAIYAERERCAQTAWSALDAVLISETGGTDLQDHVFAAIKGA